MSLTPQVLLANVARQRCISRLKELPALIYGDVKTKEAASVLVPLCVHNGEVCLLYTLRSSNLKNHSGQVSFPGGKQDDDETDIDTALRETEEEIGVLRTTVDVWSVMPPVQGRNQSLIITPVVGEIKDFHFDKLNKNEQEVEEIFIVPMQALCDTENHGHMEFRENPLPIFMYGRHKIWGITGMITHLFLNCFLPRNAYKPDFLRQKFELDELMPSKL